MISNMYMDHSQPVRFYNDNSQNNYNASKPVSDYIFPSTHNSAAYDIQRYEIVDDRGESILSLAKSLRMHGIIKRWVQNQNYDIQSQLRMGVKGLHFEISRYKTEWVCIHSFLLFYLRDVMREIETHLEIFPEDFVFIRYSPFALTRNETNYIPEIMRQYIKNKTLIREKQYNPNDIMSSYFGKITILKQTKVYPSDYSTNANNKIFLQNRQIHTPNTKKPVYFNWVMTPNKNTIITYILTPFLSTLIYANNPKHLKSYFESQNRTKMNMIYQFIEMDFVDIDMIYTILKQNLQ